MDSVYVPGAAGQRELAELPSGKFCRPAGESGTRNEPLERFLEWLAAAYALETARADRLDERAGRVSRDQTLRIRLQGHAQQTRLHAARLKECLDRLSRGRWICRIPPVPLEAEGDGLMGAVSLQPPAGGRETSRDLWEVASTEQGEVLMYTALMAAAGALGFSETVRVCREILQEENQFHDWLLEHVDSSVRQAFRTR